MAALKVSSHRNYFSSRLIAKLYLTIYNQSKVSKVFCMFEGDFFCDQLF